MSAAAPFDPAARARPPRLSVVVPARDEAETIAETIAGLAAALRGIDHEIVVVDDHSTDATAAAARSAAPGVRVVPNAGPPGFGNAVRLGLAEARGEVVVTVMADGCDDPSTITAMLAEVDRGADVVAGSRYMPGGAKRGGPRLQTLFSRGLGRFLHRFAGLPVRDVSNAFKMYRRGVVEAIRPEGDGFALSMEMLVRAHTAGFRLAEVPTRWTERRRGRSKFRYVAVYRTYLGWTLWALGYALARPSVDARTPRRYHPAMVAARPDWYADLCCPSCRGDLSASAETLRCGRCAADYPVRDGIPYLLPPEKIQSLETVEDWGRQWGDEFFPNREKTLAMYLDPAPELHVWQVPAAWFRGKRVLDMGCGDGRLARFLIGYGAEVRATDLSAAVHRMRSFEEFRTTPIVRGDATLPPWKPGLFDFVNCSGLLQHTRDPGAVARAAFEALKPGGALFASFYPRPKNLLGLLKIRVMGGIRNVLALFPPAVRYRFSRWSIPCTTYFPLTLIGRVIFIDNKHDPHPNHIWLLNHDNYIHGFQNTFTREEALRYLTDAGFERITEAEGYPLNFLAWKPA